MRAEQEERRHGLTIYEDLLRQVAVDAEGDRRAEVERLHFAWLLACLADAVRQVMLAPTEGDWREWYTWRRERVLQLLDTIEDVQTDALALVRA